MSANLKVEPLWPITKGEIFIKPKANQRTGTDTVDAQGTKTETETVIKAVRVKPKGEAPTINQIKPYSISIAADIAIIPIAADYATADIAITDSF